MPVCNSFHTLKRLETNPMHRPKAVNEPSRLSTMNKPNITQGTWTVGINPGEVFNTDRTKRIVDNSYVPTQCSRIDYPEQEREANARAIAALPDLIAALAGMLESYAPFHQQSVERKGGEDGLHSSVRAARAALTKAGYTF